MILNLLMMVVAVVSPQPNEQLRAFETTVQSVSGAAVTLKDATGLAVGDRIIIESTHGYGEAGLDGVYEYIGAPRNFYYTDILVGKSFVGTVQKVQGATVTLDRPVPSAAVGKKVYRDNDAAVKYAIEHHLPWPKSQSFAVACYPTPIRCYLPDDQETIDFGGCELFSPRGVPSVSLSVMRLYELGGGGLNNKVFKNLTLRGNAKSAGYGFLCERNSWGVPVALYVGGTSGPQGRISKNLRVENCAFIDNFESLAVQLADGVVVQDCLATFTDHLHHYIQWEFCASSCTNVTFHNCRVDSDFARAGFEAFKCKGVTFDSCVGRNASFSLNASGEILLSQCGVIWDQEYPNSAFSPYNPMLNINRNIEDQNPDGPKYPGGDIRVRGFSVEYRKAPYPKESRIFQTIAISPGAGVDITGVSLRVPRTSLSTPNLGYLVRTDDAGSFARGFTGDKLDDLPAYVKQNKTMTPDPAPMVKVELSADEWSALLKTIGEIKEQLESK